MVERILGKDKVTSSILVVGSTRILERDKIAFKAGKNAIGKVFVIFYLMKGGVVWQKKPLYAPNRMSISAP